jgi:hypothetical protein
MLAPANSNAAASGRGVRKSFRLDYGQMKRGRLQPTTLP